MVECPHCATRYDESPAFCGACGGKMPGPAATTARNADPLIGMVIDGRYRIVDLIGRGGMGAVYRVEHVKMGKIMAIKILHGELNMDSDLVRRFKREAETVSRLDHLHTVSVFDFGSHQGMMYLVMEYIEGRDLAEVLRLDGPLEFKRAATILIQVLSALGEAHRKGIIHRDLKPENILVGRINEQDDFVKVLDFGLAKLRDRREQTHITAQGSLVGTPYYMAPEHIRGEGVDARSDIYALGAVMYKLLTGETPFSANTPMGVITKHLTEQVGPPSRRFPRLEIPSLADDIVLKAMDKDPSRRYETAAEMRTALADAVEMLAPGSAAARYSSYGEGSEVRELPLKTPRRPVEAPPEEQQSYEDLEGPRDPAATPVIPDPGGRGWSEEPPSTTLGKSVIVGAREVAIGTRSDFLNYERRLRRRRILQGVFAVVLLLGAIGAVAYWALVVNRDPSDPTRETEPNDSPAQADPLTTAITLGGTIAGPQPQGDIDWFRLRGLPDGAWAVAVAVSGVEGLDLALQLVDPQRADPLAEANAGGPGVQETIGPLAVEAPDVYLMIQEVRHEGIPPASFPDRPYGVTYQVYDASTLEREPNDVPTSATAMQPRLPVAGQLAAATDVDWYCLPAAAEVTTVQVTGLPGADLLLVLRTSPTEPEIPINVSGPNLGEGATIPRGAGPVCAAVKLLNPEGPAPDSNASYQIIFQ